VGGRAAATVLPLFDEEAVREDVPWISRLI
jgi:hypothetical protein